MRVSAPDAHEWVANLQDLRAAFAALQTDMRRQMQEVTGFAERSLLDAGAEVAHFYADSDTLSRSLGSVHDQVTGRGLHLTTVFAEQNRFFGNFLQLLEGFFVQHGRHAREGAAQTTKMIEGSKRIAALNNSAKILAINARIEASRAGDHGRAFGIIAGELQKWSDEIQRTNTLVQELATSLAAILPEIAHGTETIVGRFKAESASLADGLQGLEAEYASGSEAILQTLGYVLEMARNVHERSNRVLSLLQFQDYLSQRVLQLETAAGRHSDLALDLIRWLLEQPDDTTVAELRPQVLALASDRLAAMQTSVPEPMCAVPSADDITFF